MLRVTTRTAGDGHIRVIGQPPAVDAGSVRRHMVRQESRKLHTIGANAATRRVVSSLPRKGGHSVGTVA